MLERQSTPTLACARGCAEPSVLVVGLGNPILGDDGVGWTIAQQVADRVKGNEQVEVDCLAVGGLSLMERMLGYGRVILIDAIQTGQQPIGAVRVFDLCHLPSPGLGHSTSAHDASLLTALNTAKAMGAVVPKRVEIVAVEAEVGLDFTESLSQPVAAAVTKACDAVLELIRA